jgi:hypothetical protein
MVDHGALSSIQSSAPHISIENSDRNVLNYLKLVRSKKVSSVDAMKGDGVNANLRI